MTSNHRRFCLYVALLTLVACSNEQSLSISAQIPSGWRYVSNTTVAPSNDHIEFSPRALRLALERGQASPLFALTRGPAHGTRATLGISASRLTQNHLGTAADALQQMLDDAGGQLQRIGAIRRFHLNGYDAAQVALSAPAQQELMITIILAHQLMLTVAGAAPNGEQGQEYSQDIATFTRRLKLSPEQKVSVP